MDLGLTSSTILFFCFVLLFKAPKTWVKVGEVLDASPDSWDGSEGIALILIIGRS